VHTKTITLTVKNFTIVAANSSKTVTHGGAAGTDVITLTFQGGFTGTVTFNCTGLPANATKSFSPATVSTNNGTTTLSITAASNTPTGTYNLSVTGTNGTLVQTIPITLIVN
jgi:hypothetical protein